MVARQQVTSRQRFRSPEAGKPALGGRPVVAA